MKCERCNGLGLPAYKHIADGMCFECGATPAGVKASETVRASRRERLIGKLHGLIRRAAQEKEAGTVGEWWADVLSDEDTALRGHLATAPRDVHARAVAAFAKLGLSV